LHNKQNQLSDTNIKPQIGNNYRKSVPQSDFVKTSTIAKGTGENTGLENIMIFLKMSKISKKSDFFDIY